MTTSGGYEKRDSKRSTVEFNTGRRRSSDSSYVFSSVPRERPRSQPVQNGFARPTGTNDTENRRRGSGGGTAGKNHRNSLTINSGSGPSIVVQLHESKSELNQGGNKGAGGDGGGEGNSLTRHDLYKEAIYTCVHMLGTPSPKRFPSTQQEMCLYAHAAFSANLKEQSAVLDHVQNEPFPLTIINTKVRRADGLQGSKPNGMVDPYCIVTIETEDSLGRREWQNFSTGTPVRKSKDLGSYKKNLRPPAEHRTMQVYEKVPQFIKTSVQRHKKNPEWNQRFQCLALRPSVDKLTVEVWDHSIDDKYVAKAIRNYAEPEGITDLETTLKTVHENADRKRGDVFLGKVSVRVSEIPCDGIDNWYYLTGTPQTKDAEARGKIRLQIWLVHAYRHGKHFAEIAEPKVVLDELWDWILKTEKSAYIDPADWDGSIPTPATCLLFQYALQNGISEDTHAIIRWNAYAKHDLDLRSVEGRLTELNDVMDKNVQVVTPEARNAGANPRKSVVTERIRDSQAEIEENIMEIVTKKILPIIRNHLKEHIDAVHEALGSYKGCIEILSKFEVSFSLQKIQWLFDAALRMSILEWYQETHWRLVPSRGEVQKSQYVGSICKVMMEVNALVSHGATKWSPEFWLIAGVEYLPVVYDELQKMVIHDVEAVCWLFFEFYHDLKKLRKILLGNDEKDKSLYTAFFELYTQTQIFVLTQIDLFPDGKKNSYAFRLRGGPRPYCCLNEYYRWFRPTLVLWLGFALIKGSSMISKTINIDNHVQDNEHAMTSTSALDTANVFCQLVNFWNALNWPDIAEGYVIIHFLMDVICAFTLLYAQLKHAKLDKEGYYDPHGKFTISERLCTALNNIEYVKEYCQRIPTEIYHGHIIETLEEACGKSRLIMAYEESAQTSLERTLQAVDQHIDDILDSVGLRIQSEMLSFIDESFKSLADAQSQELDTALDPIKAYLEDNIVTLQNALLPFNFLRVLKMLWNLVCRGLRITGKSFRFGNTMDQNIFFKRVLQVIPSLQSYFEGGDAGLSLAEMNTPDFEETNQLLRFFTTSTEELIGIYYSSRGHHIMKNEGEAKFGRVRVRIGYWNQRLSIEVISASDLKAHDEPLILFKYFQKAQATSDPFVELELRPSFEFKNEKKFTTNVQWKNLNPVFEESFYWPITSDHCLKPAASLVVTVKDYDLLNANAFLGEAIIPLHLIPGISSMPEPQPMSLILQEVDKNHMALEVLKSREWDVTAKQFTDEQLQKVVEPVIEKKRASKLSSITPSPSLAQLP